MKRFRKYLKKLNNAGVTMAELIVTFMLLALFMVAATRMIAYTVGIYYATKGATYGLEVANMISNKVVGQIEGARSAKTPTVTVGAAGIDTIEFVDNTGSEIAITADEVTLPEGNKTYINIRYAEVTDGSVKYDAVDWRFDSKAYMDYEVIGLNFESPGAQYPENVTKMTLCLHSGKYGDYERTYYIKCANVEKIEYK